jgi:hypothetical protein
VCQDPFTERRTADVAKAYEKNRNVVFRGHGINRTTALCPPPLLT